MLAGDTISVQWTPSITNPKVSYNYNLASSPWQPFTTVIPVNSQEVKVALPTTWYSDSFQIKVEDGAGVYDTGISGYLHLKYIILTTAFTGKIVKVGDSITLNWRINPSMFSSLALMLSTDSGKVYNAIPNISLPKSSQSFTWIVGSETGWIFTFPSSRCKIMIQDYFENSYKDVSDIFTVRKPIVITSPATGAKLLAGDTVSVQWTPSIANPKVSYNYNLPSSVWEQFATVIPVSSQEVKVALPTMWYSDSFQIKVEDNDGAHDAGVTGYLREKYIIITNPVAGQVFSVNQSVNITFKALASKLTSLRLRLSTGGGYQEMLNTSIQPSLQSYTWVIGSEPGDTFTYPSTTCKIRIDDYNHVDEIFDISGIFSVQ